MRMMHTSTNKKKKKFNRACRGFLSSRFQWDAEACGAFNFSEQNSLASESRDTEQVIVTPDLGSYSMLS